MAQGPDDSKPEDGKILSPEELDIADDDHVTQIDEGRYVVSPEIRDDDDNEPSTVSRSGPAAEPKPEAESREFNDSDVHAWLAEQMARSNASYGFDVTAKFDGDVDQQQLTSNDIVTVFETMMLWYGRQLDGSTPVEDVLGILLSESNVPVKYPPGTIKSLAQSSGLSPDDSIGDLIDAVEARDGASL